MRRGGKYIPRHYIRTGPGSVEKDEKPPGTQAWANTPYHHPPSVLPFQNHPSATIPIPGHILVLHQFAPLKYPPDLADDDGDAEVDGETGKAIHPGPGPLVIKKD